MAPTAHSLPTARTSFGVCDYRMAYGKVSGRDPANPPRHPRRHRKSLHKKCKNMHVVHATLSSIACLEVRNRSRIFDEQALVVKVVRIARRPCGVGRHGWLQ